MQGKWPDQTLDQAFGLPEVLVAISTSRLSCKRAGKTRTLMPVWDSSGESRIMTRLSARRWARPAKSYEMKLRRYGVSLPRRGTGLRRWSSAVTSMPSGAIAVWHVNRKAFSATPFDANGKPGVMLRLRPLFEEYHEQTR